MLQKLALFLVLTIAIGCTPPADSTASDKAPQTEAKTDASTAVAEKTACAACGKEVAASEMKVDHGQKVCQACYEAHGHS